MCDAFGILLPTTLTLITTYKCSARCENCCFECSPNKTEKIPLEVAINHIEKVHSLYENIKIVVLTGGECFLDFGYLISLIKHINSLGMLSRVVTNAFWATNKGTALRMLTECHATGLNEINISTGDEHLEYVPLEYIKNAINSAVELGLTVVVNIESGKDCIFKVGNFLNDENLKNYISRRDGISPRLSIINGMWMPFTNQSLMHLPKMEQRVFHPCKDRCFNLFNSITISPDNRLLACCGLPVKYIKELNLGNLYKYSIADLYKSQFEDFLKIWLYVDGPYKILSFLENKLEKSIPELNCLSHTCFYCAVLFTNGEYLDAAKKYYKEIFSSVLLRYAFHIKTLKL